VRLGSSRLPPAAAAAVAVIVAVLALGAYLVARGDSGDGAAGEQVPRLTVLAAASLTEALPAVDPRPRYSFAGSNALAAQLESGAPADVFASADPEILARLSARGLVSQPVTFASNRLVLVVPRSNPAGIRTVEDVARPGVAVAIAAPDVPVGGYTLAALRTLGVEPGVLANVASRETDVRAVLTKVAVGQADAGFVYASDVAGASGRVLAIPLPPRAQPEIAYAIAVVAATEHPEAAQAFVERLLSPRGQAALEEHGFARAAAGTQASALGSG
jgi:molybdate transport system substrate-binding protein